MKVIFLDASVLMHFRPVGELPWLRLADAEAALLVVAPTTIRDLDNVKDAPGQRKRKRERVSSVTTWIDELLGKASQVPEGSLTSVAPGVQVLLLGREPTLNFAQHRLNERLTDDCLLASMVEYREHHPEADVWVATGDRLMKLKAPLHELRVLTLPDDLRLPHELDEVELRNRELEQEIARLKHLVPRLRLCFADRASHVKYGLPGTGGESRDPNAMLAAAKREHPRMTQDTGGARPRAVFVGAQAAEAWRALVEPSPEDMAAYNDRLEQYYQEYWDYAVALAAYDSRVPLKLEIRVLNEGTCPAENVRVLMHFPGDFLVCGDDDFPAPPREPTPPPKPRGRIGAGPAEFAMPSPRLSSSVIADVVRNLAPPGNVSRAHIRRTESYEVELSVRFLQHHDEDGLPPLYAVFESAEAVQSFQIEYWLIADNTPTPQDGKLHVVWEPAPGNRGPG